MKNSLIRFGLIVVIVYCGIQCVIEMAKYAYDVIDLFAIIAIAVFALTRLNLKERERGK